MKRSIISAAILGALGLGSSFTTLATNHHVVDLCVGQFTKTLLGNPTPVPMWGYALGGATGNVCNGVLSLSSPGPQIIIPDGSSGLTINLVNTLPRATSLVIPGTVKGMAPVFFTDSNGLDRVKSFDAEAPTGGVTAATYTWDNLQPGSYMYHSGTHPQVQVQMGLFGAVTNDFSAAGKEAYDGVPYTDELILFYSEIDETIHHGVDAGGYDEFDMKSTIDYDPKYFFIDAFSSNGTVPTDTNGLPIVTVSKSALTLVRFYNAGLQTHIPTVFEAGFDIVAEDAKKYPASRKQYSMLLPALKTRDAYLNVTGATGGQFQLSDSAMALSNPATIDAAARSLAVGDAISNGDGNGMVVNIAIKSDPNQVVNVPDGDEPVARSDRMAVLEGDSLSSIMVSALSNDINAKGAKVTILSYPKQGQLVSDGSGDFTYQHDGGEESKDSMVYSLTNESGESSTTGVNFDIAPVNDAPEANDDTVQVTVGQTVEIRALANDEDVDSPTISITGVGESALGVLTALEQVIVFEPTSVGSEDIVYTIADTSGDDAFAVLHLNVIAGTNSGQYSDGSSGSGSGSTTDASSASFKPTAINDSYSVKLGTALDITGNAILGVLANDSNADAVNTQLVVYPTHGAIQMFSDGTFVYTHDGSESDSDQFTYEIYNDYGLAEAKVSIAIQPDQELVQRIVRGSNMSPPIVNNDQASTDKGEFVLIDLLENDVDKDSEIDSSNIIITEQPKHGTLEVISKGMARYRPDTFYTGKDFFSYRLKDSVTGELSEQTAIVDIAVK